MTALIAGLLTGGLTAAVATPALARPQGAGRQAQPTLTARLVPPVVTVGEPAAVAAQITPARSGRPVEVQGRTGNTWTDLGTATTDATGRATLVVDTSVAGSTTLRAVAGSLTSGQVTLTVRDPAACRPSVPLVDPDATPEARCLAARLDRWHAAGLMGVGQQVTMSSVHDVAMQPLSALGGRRVPVVGFDLWELEKTQQYQFPFYDTALQDLVDLAHGGAVLTASWHAPNPHTGGDYQDRSWHDLGAVLEDTPEADAFWADYQSQLAILADLQSAGVPVVLRPLHEANGRWFWWGTSNGATYRAVWRQMQQRAWAAGVHNVLWAYSFNARTDKTVADPVSLLPAKVDVAGIDSYYIPSRSSSSTAPSMAGYAAVAKKVRRMAFTEVGPYADKKGRWDPTVVTATARAQARRPLWALFWVDDAAGEKQIASLSGGRTWLDSCPFGFCRIG